jgi:predicted dehydrogenase
LSVPDIVLGQIGYGYWGPNLARCFMELQGARLKYICDTDSENLAEAGRRCPGVELTQATEAVMEDEEVEALVIAAPAATHNRLAREALLAGKHVFVEKPMSLDLGEGSELVDIARAAGLVLFVGHVFLYHPAVRFIREYLASGEAGDVLYMYSSRLNLGRLRRDENCMWSLAPHDISIMLYLVGEEPDSVIAQGGAYLRQGLEDVVFLTLHFPRGILGNIHVSWLDPRKVRTTTIVGDRQMIVFDDMSPDQKVKVFDRKVYPVTRSEVMGFGDELRIHYGEETVPPVAMEEPLVLECTEFRDSILKGSQPLTDGRQGLSVLRVLDAAGRSLAAEGVRVAVKR